MKDLFYRWVFSVLMWALTFKISRALAKNKKVKALAADRKSTIVLGVNNSRLSRVFNFDTGCLSAHAHRSDGARVEVSFISAQVAVKTFLSGTMNGFMRGIQNKSIVVSGDYMQMIWFSSLVKAVLKS